MNLVYKNNNLLFKILPCILISIFAVMVLYGSNVYATTTTIPRFEEEMYKKYHRMVAGVTKDDFIGQEVVIFKDNNNEINAFVFFYPYSDSYIKNPYFTFTYYPSKTDHFSFNNGVTGNYFTTFKLDNGTWINTIDGDDPFMAPQGYDFYVNFGVDDIICHTLDLYYRNSSDAKTLYNNKNYDEVTTVVTNPETPERGTEGNNNTNNDTGSGNNEQDNNGNDNADSDTDNSFIDSIVNIAKDIANLPTLIAEKIGEIFIPKSENIQSKFDEVKEIYENKFSLNLDLSSIFQTGENASDFYINYKNNNIKILDMSFFNDNYNKFKPLVRSFFGILIFVYNYKKYQSFVGGGE